LSFREGPSWTFFERGATVIAKIQDKEFWRQVHEHTLTFGEGDRLRVKLIWKMETKSDKLTAKNHIERESTKFYLNPNR
ncbi:MAG TPA: hypothetical protein VME86_03705, partial [Acidobacteriaceae bacterium]|nr:hypothetical protein [Acidobacteriaceae bacterium]